ncbi:putative lectin family integral membrane protein [Zalerion maritima]|uniref:Lectin family integral membrane protein n=1 Tax=Zalerion maritima TaxID=339359 RepID=A0AAD5WUR5_9PEZI|nr:putative lectin family integral membrane protein [Zalerion maritima]
MRIDTSSLFQSLALLLSAAGHAAAQSQFLVSEMSFGHSGKLSTDGTRGIPGFIILGNPDQPQVLSNKIILTPPTPGHQRGAIWSEKQSPYHTWTADVDFRVSGPERGGGNLNVWLASEGDYRVATNSIYTVGKWDGLVIIIDQYGGSGGMIRGFLNDGTIDFQAHQAVDSLAFGHCLFPYRNRGIASQLKVRHSDEGGLRVEIDGRLCFESDKIRIPPGYNFGITSASAENPDSHEIFKMVVMTENLSQGGEQQQQQQQQQQIRQQDNQAQKPAGGRSEKTRYSRGGMFVDRDPLANEEFEEETEQDADSITSSKAQFADLHNRLQSVNNHLSTIFRQVASQNSIGERRQEELSSQINDLKQMMSKLDAIDDLKKTVQNIQKQVNNIKRDLGNQIRNNENNLKSYVSDTHDALHQKVLDAAPGHGKLIMVIIGSQLFMAGVYLYYKKRKNSSPKKFL